MEQMIREEVSADDFAFLKKFVSAKDSRINSAALLEFLNVYDLIGYAAIPTLPLELAVIKLTNSPASPAGRQPPTANCQH